jgi:hypothetical protein
MIRERSASKSSIEIEFDKILYQLQIISAEWRKISLSVLNRKGFSARP